MLIIINWNSPNLQVWLIVCNDMRLYCASSMGPIECLLYGVAESVRSPNFL